MKYELYKWYDSSDYNLEYALIPLKNYILERNQSVLLEFANGLIEADRYFYYQNNMEMGRQYNVKRFMLIQL
jgi:hypothetical protein